MTVKASQHHAPREPAIVHSYQNQNAVVALTDKLAAYLTPNPNTAEVRMFQMLEVGGGRRRFRSMIGSFLMQVGLVVLALAIPLLFTDTISLAKNTAISIAAPPPPPPPAPPKSAVTKTRPTLPEKKVFVLQAPNSIPKDTPRIIEDFPAPEVVAGNGIPGGIPGGTGNGKDVGLGNIPIPAPAPPAPPVKEQPKETPKVVRLGGDVQAAKLVNRVVPVYPQMAKQVRVQGTVKLSATIGRNGTVENLVLISGPPLLVAAAMDAVKRWVYQPTLLNGEPVGVLTTIDVNFTLTN